MRRPSSRPAAHPRINTPPPCHPLTATRRRCDAYATEFDLEAEEYVPLPKGDVHKRREVVQVRAPPPQKDVVAGGLCPRGDVHTRREVAQVRARPPLHAHTTPPMLALLASSL